MVKVSRRLRTTNLYKARPSSFQETRNGQSESTIFWKKTGMNPLLSILKACIVVLALTLFHWSSEFRLHEWPGVHSSIHPFPVCHLSEHAAWISNRTIHWMKNPHKFFNVAHEVPPDHLSISSFKGSQLHRLQHLWVHCSTQEHSFLSSVCLE